MCYKIFPADKCALNYSQNSVRAASQKSLRIFVFDIYFPTCGDDVVMGREGQKGREKPWKKTSDFQRKKGSLHRAILTRCNMN